MERALNDLKSKLSQQSRTAKLWISYMSYVFTLKQLIRAERTADWHFHLINMSKMVNLIAPTWHNNYTKCARLYIERMTDLPYSHPALYDQFMKGGHVAHRSKRLWGGLSTDLTIEQAMMRAIKSRAL